MTDPTTQQSGMSLRQYLLAKLGEECNEVAQQAIKAQIFGVHEVQPGQTLDNMQRVQGEFLDLLGVWEMLADEQLVPHIGYLLGDPLTKSVILRRKLKVSKYYEYAKTQGTVV